MSEDYKIQQAMSAGKASSLQRYMKLVLGQESIGRLLLYEFVLLISSRRSGALGLFLRKKMYPWILGSVGRNVVFGANITLRHPHKISIGDDVIVDENVSLDAKGDDNQGIRLDDAVFIGRNTILSCKNGDIVLEKKANLGFNCLLTSTNSIRIGEDNIIAAYTYIIGGGSYHIDGIATPIRENYDYAGKGGVITRENVWIGAHVTVLDGVTIESGSVIGAGSVVSKDVTRNTVAAGTPARSIRQRS
jgi:acetyltransferase-like isoleucine patch superfamily enzyme